MEELRNHRGELVVDASNKAFMVEWMERGQEKPFVNQNFRFHVFTELPQGTVASLLQEQFGCTACSNPNELLEIYPITGGYYVYIKENYSA